MFTGYGYDPYSRPQVNGIFDEGVRSLLFYLPSVRYLYIRRVTLRFDLHQACNRYTRQFNAAFGRPE